MNLSLSRSEGSDPGWLGNGVVAALGEICAALGPDESSIGVVVVDDAFIRDINARYRGQDRPTDVITFSYIDEKDLGVGDDLAGEVYISHETVAREAARLGVATANLFLRVGVHGVLHALGRDHETDGDALRMEREEREILTSHLDAGVVDGLF